MSEFRSPDTLSSQPYAYDVSDLRALNWQITRWWHVVPSILIYAFLAWFFVSIMREEGISWILVGILLVIPVLVVGPWTWRPLLTHRSLRRQGLLEPMTAGITPDCLVVDAAKADARIKWTGIRRIKRTSNRLFLFRSKAVAHIVPRHAFGSDEQFESFVSAAETEWNEHQQR